MRTADAVIHAGFQPRVATAALRSVSTQFRSMPETYPDSVAPSMEKRQQNHGFESVFGLQQSSFSRRSPPGMNSRRRRSEKAELP
jgi:hypothetical protein